MSGEEEKKHLLVVDDNPSHIHVVHSISKDDYKIHFATSGARALDLAKVEPQPDLILLDVMMPDMDGYEVRGRLKDNPETRDIPELFAHFMTHLPLRICGLAQLFRLSAKRPKC